METSGIITLTTDFGCEDVYVAVMKGVILGIHPGATLVDITHGIRPGDIRQGARMLEEATRFFPPGTIHLAVVDPGVGGARRPLLVCTGSSFLVGPDNGIFWPLIEAVREATVLHLTSHAYFLPEISRTFHGRDIFAPVAGHLACGVDPLDLGTLVQDPARLELPTVKRSEDAIEGEVIRVDRFGNLITNIHQQDIRSLGCLPEAKVTIGDHPIKGIRETYSSVPRGGILALLGSSGFLEIAVNQGRASALVGGNGTSEGVPVRVSRPHAGPADGVSGG